LPKPETLNGYNACKGGTAMIRFNGINHLAMATGDMDKTILYWRDLLGMRLVGGVGKEGYRHYFFQISDNDLLAFFEWTDVKPVANKEHGKPVTGPFVFDHISFGVENKDNLWELKDKLSEAGFHVSEVVDHGFILSIYSHDPNGIPVEFSWNVEGINIRKDPKMGDVSASAITREGPEPQSGKWPEVNQPTPVSERKVYPGAGSEIFHGIKGA
jgi:catechol 2,3-dioxygenase-like lactoylglutathione lyase family enzyme